MVARPPEAMFYENMGRIYHTKTTRDTERRNLEWLSFFGGAQTSRPASGRARLAARVRESAAVEQSRSCKQNPPPMPVRAVCLRQAATDAGLRRYLNPAFYRNRRGGRPVGRPVFIHCTDKIENAFPAQTFDFPQSSIRRENPYLRPSQKVLGIPKTLSQKGLWRGSGRRPAHPLAPAYSC